jgi:hypothetical protein
MKSEGWKLLFSDSRVQHLRRNEQWKGWRSLWDEYTVLYEELWKPTGQADVVTKGANKMSQRLHSMKVRTNSPWVHIMLYHVPEFVSQLGNLERSQPSTMTDGRTAHDTLAYWLTFVLCRFATTAVEGSHRRVKRWYGRSMQGTVS